MKKLLLWGMLFFASCNQSRNASADLKPADNDTSKSWARQMTEECLKEAKRMEEKLGLGLLSDGSANSEIRLWLFSDSYDPQLVYILKKNSSNEWRLRRVSYYKTQNDSLYAEYSRSITQNAVDSLYLDQYWTIASQGDLKTGEAYGCMDGADLFIELGGPSKYRFMWYRCPDINRDRDSAFFYADRLMNEMDALAIDHP